MMTVIVPVLNEAENIAGLVGEIEAAAGSAPIGEILYVDDGSVDATLANLRAEQAARPLLRVVRHDRRLGQSAAFLSGARAAKGDILVFMDGDGQNDPADIATLFSAYRNEAAASAVPVAVLGQRAARNDSRAKRISSRLANALRQAVLQDGTRDTGCSLKLIRRDDFLALPYFDHMHRFLPALLMRNGVSLRHVDVSHRPRTRGTSKYGFWNRALIGAVDLVGTAWLLRRRLPRDYAATEIFAERTT